MNEKKNNHYVPKFYLRNFSNNGKSVGMYSIKHKKYIKDASISDVAYKKYLYGEDGVLENWLAKLEGEWARITSEIISSKRIPQEQDYIKFLFFVLMSEARTLKNADFHDETIDALSKIMLEMNQRHGHLDASIDLEGFRIQHKIPNLYSFMNIQKLVPYLFDLKGLIFVNNSNKGFVTSDYPLVKYNQLFIKKKYDRSFGLGHVGIQIFFPLNEILCFCLFDKDMYNGYENKNELIEICSGRQIDELNKLFALNSYDYLFFNNSLDENYIQKLLNERDEGVKEPEILKFGGGDNVYLMSRQHVVKVPIKLPFDLKRNQADICLPAHMGGPIRPYVDECEKILQDRSAELGSRSPQSFPNQTSKT